MAYYVKTTIIAAFPGLDQDLVAARFPTMARVIHSSDYNTDVKWPENLIEQLTALDKSGMYRRVFIDKDPILRKKLAKAGIKYTILAPTDDPKMKKTILDRLKALKWTDEQIADINTHWSEYIDEMVHDSNAIGVLQLTMENINLWDNYVLME